MNYKVSAKRNGKWWTFGSIKKNQFGNLQLSFKNTPELKEFVANGGEWLNLSLFDTDEKKEIAPEAQQQLDKLKKSALDSEEIPF